MSKFYVDVSLNRNEVLLRGYENGRRIQESIEYKPYVFVPAKKETKFKTLEGHYVDKLEFDSIREARDFIKKYEDVENFKIYGLTNFDYLFIYDNYPGKIEFDPSLISLVILDIETDSSSGFPDIQLADKAVTAITLKKNGKALSLGMKYYKPKTADVEYVLCKDEAELLRNFLFYWNSEKWSPDVISGWNIDHFDIPYLVNRITRVLSEEDAKRLSPWGKLHQKRVFIKGREVEMFVPVGIQVLDYMEVYKKFSFKVQESYSLNYIASEVLGEKKVDYSEYGSLHNLYEKNFELFIDYNVHDCTLIERLEDKLGMIKQIYITAFMTKVNFTDMFATVRPWDGLIHSYLLDRGIVVPQVEAKIEQAFEGGYVKEVNPSKFGWLVSFDVTSMYPHIVISQNISPETYLGRLPQLTTDDLLNGGLEKHRNEIKKNDYSVAGNMCVYRRDKQGFLAALMKQIFDSRAEFKKKKKEAEKRYEESPSEELKKEIATYDVAQQALKIIANLGYGAVSNRWFRFFSIANAQAITLTGQLTIRWVEKKLNEYMNKILKTKDESYVIYVDTDSVAGNSVVTVNDNEISIEKFFDEVGEEWIVKDDFNKRYVKKVTGKETYSVDKNGNLTKNEIVYVMKHQVKKKMFRVKMKDRFVDVTEDHSIIVRDIVTNQIIEMKPASVSVKRHQIINIVGGNDTDRKGINEILSASTKLDC